MPTPSSQTHADPDGGPDTEPGLSLDASSTHGTSARDWRPTTGDQETVTDAQLHRSQAVFGQLIHEPQPDPPPLTLRDLTDALADASMVQPVYLRDPDGALWPVLDVTIAPRQGLVILETNPIPEP